MWIPCLVAVRVSRTTKGPYEPCALKRDWPNGMQAILANPLQLYQEIR